MSLHPVLKAVTEQIVERSRPYRNAYLARLSLAPANDGDPAELTLFPDGRVIVKGTDDPAAARSLVARYIGY